MTNATKGLIAMIGASIIWGLSPIAFQAMSDIPPLEVLAHRGIWSLVIFGAVLTFQGRLAEFFAALRSRRAIVLILLAAGLIMGGWWLFIWAIQTGKTTQTALGFYIFPLVAVLFGRIFFGERLLRGQGVAVVLVVLAASVLTYGAGALPWIALGLATNFALYGVIKKHLTMGPVVSVTAEVLFMLPVLVLILWQTGHNGGGHFGGWTRETSLLIFAGPLTAVPLILFSYATRRLTFTSTGLISYINPSLQFFCAVILFSEPFSLWHGVAFGLIWTALALYSWVSYRSETATSSPAKAVAASGAISK